MRNEMNRMTEWQVGGILMNDEKFKVIVKAPYGYRAMREAEKLVGKIKAGSAMRIQHFPTAECAECGEDVPTPYQPTHACVRLV
jgi:hypothetical protein